MELETEVELDEEGILDVDALDHIVEEEDDMVELESDEEADEPLEVLMLEVVESGYGSI